MQVTNAILTALGSPVMATLGSVALILGVVALRRWVLPWIKQARDAARERDAEAQSKRSQEENERMNKDVGKVFDL